MPGPETSVVVERNLLIPLPDGVQLAADLYRPAGAGRWPAIIDFLPYHKDGRGGRLDVEAVNRSLRRARVRRTDRRHPRARQLRRASTRLPFDPQEARDGHDAVEWVAAQPWCDGNVGMWGVSYGGITALAVAATRPPHLRAIVPIHACADLYHDLVAARRLPRRLLDPRATGVRAWWRYNLTPPLARGRRRALGAGVGGSPRGERAVALRLVGPPGLRRVLGGRASSRWSGSRCPTFNIGGWRDLYAEATVRDHARIPAPKRLLMGPWKHAFPDVALDARRRASTRWSAGGTAGSAAGTRVLGAEPPP